MYKRQVYGLTGTEINIQDVTYVVEGDNPPVAQLGAGGEPTDVDRAVANLVVPQIPNGACLQLGIGGMPNTCLLYTSIEPLLYSGYSSISLGYIGLYEVTKLVKGCSQTTPEGQAFSLKVMELSLIHI